MGVWGMAVAELWEEMNKKEAPVWVFQRYKTDIWLFWEQKKECQMEKERDKKNEQLVTLFSSLHTLPRHGEVCGLSGNAKAAQKSCAEKKKTL